MSYLKFDQSKLVNLEYSLGIEYLRSNRAGTFASSTLTCCNTRKYHGLLICPLDELDGQHHVLLSTLDETIVQHDKEFRLAVHKYPGNIHPGGHKYLEDFQNDPIPTTTYRVGGVVLQKDRLLSEHDDRVLIRYTLKECHSPTKLKLHPFLAFRSIHSLSKANMYASNRYEEIENGIKTRLYEGYPHLHMQFSKEVEYVSAPNWYYNVEYPKDMERGYDYHEDLFVPGYFEMELEKGESVIFSAGIEQIKATTLMSEFSAELKKRIPRLSFEHCIENAARQFFVNRHGYTEIIAGFPWLGTWARNTFIALPSLTLSRGEIELCKEILDSMSAHERGSLFNNARNDWQVDIDTADAPLWFIWAVQNYALYSSEKKAWNFYNSRIKRIFNVIKNGVPNRIMLAENGLVHTGGENTALTWMNAWVDGKPVTPRVGFNVEINALWYNAVCFSVEAASEAGDKTFAAEWKPFIEQIKNSFVKTFWNAKKGYLADNVCNGTVDWSIRPNQIMAASLLYSPLNDDQKYAVTENVKRFLLTPRGLRTLSPEHPDYKGEHSGNYKAKDLAYHQGSVYPWLLAHFTEAYLALHQKSGVALIEKIYDSFEEEMSRHGIGTISELYDGNPPHMPRGAISDACSVAAIIKMKKLIDYYKLNHDSPSEVS